MTSVVSFFLLFHTIHHLVGQIHHAQVRLYFEAEGREAGHAVLRPGELVEDDGVFRVQLLLLPAHRSTEGEELKHTQGVTDYVYCSLHKLK